MGAEPPPSIWLSPRRGWKAPPAKRQGHDAAVQPYGLKQRIISLSEMGRRSSTIFVAKNAALVSGCTPS